MEGFHHPLLYTWKQVQRGGCASFFAAHRGSHDNPLCVDWCIETTFSPGRQDIINVVAGIIVLRMSALFDGGLRISRC